ncbi:ribosome recycling factor [Aquicella lusitana]|uniref:Ribosome-recycling factor n=1 Tax=Aquicella lusitana TaxID=254246 RepID=A0A370GHE2_9COXI|nr:ribosome recycling factor [Aquicella lusitana]RDI41804.1 ribosome recycling factor [Aquicella lusitana]VVC73712.1 Ribosome-recycling factor [Aquicella lusitana]
MHKVIKDADTRMRKSIDSFKTEIAKLRTGRANPSILDHIRVDYYGSEMPINQVANITVSDARTLTITPWEKKMVQVIEKAILNSDLGLNPATSGDIIRVPMPALNEERRKELIKVVRNEAEAARVSIRNVRRDANALLKEMLKGKEITEDEERRLGDEVQKLTDKFVAEVDQLTTAKETDLMAI